LSAEKHKEQENKRGAGVLLHITSLPSLYGIGDFGEGAYRFVDFLAEAKQKFWQILPLNPTATVLGNSPYSSVSAFAGNTIFLSPELLVRDGLLSRGDADSHPSFPNNHVDYHTVTEYKNRILRLAFQKFGHRADKDFQKFCKDNAAWLDDYSLFLALKENFNGVAWNDWPAEVRDRKKVALKAWREKLHGRIAMENFFQYLFFRQWNALKDYCRGKGVKIIGDIPIYVTCDSADVWAHQGLFKLDKDGKPSFMAGVPPDYFSTTGQLWGNPVYRWNALKEQKYAWWLQRFEHNLKLFDIIRVDHFRGFVAYWEVPAGEVTAVNGRWVKVPVSDFFKVITKRFSKEQIIAEDLGHITDDVRAAMAQFGFPGMKLLLFAFDDKPATNPYIPHNQVENCVVYSGTHDNNTVKGWFEKEARPEDRNRVLRYLGRDVLSSDIAWEFVKLAHMAVANTAILPLQDILNLGEESRMNRPATVGNNWQWRIVPEMLSPWITAKLREITETCGRT